VILAEVQRPVIIAAASGQLLESKVAADADGNLH
jgi:hypothetical protein